MNNARNAAMPATINAMQMKISSDFTSMVSMISETAASAPVLAFPIV